MQHLRLLGMVEVGRRHALPDAVGRHQGLSLHVHVALQGGVVRGVLLRVRVGGWRRGGTLKVGGWRWRRRRWVLQARRGSHVAHVFGGHGPQEVRILEERKSSSCQSGGGGHAPVSSARGQRRHGIPVPLNHPGAGYLREPPLPSLCTAASPQPPRLPCKGSLALRALLLPGPLMVPACWRHLQGSPAREPKQWFLPRLSFRHSLSKQHIVSKDTAGPGWPDKGHAAPRTQVHLLRRRELEGVSKKEADKKHLKAQRTKTQRAARSSGCRTTGTTPPNLPDTC